MIQPDKENRHNKSVCLVQGPGAQNPCCSEQCFSFCVNFCYVFLQVLVLGNKKDLPNSLDEKELVERL